MTERVCACEDRDVDDPLCGFCEDDLFCPQCGRPVTSVSSDEAREDGRIWIYPKRNSGDFLFLLSLACRDAARDPQVTAPQLDLQQSQVRAGRWFEPDLEELQAKQKSRPYRLKPHHDLLAKMPEVMRKFWYNGLPSQGVEACVTVCGGFGTRDFPLLICRPPDFTIVVSGSGVKPDPGRENSWRLDVLAPLSLDLEIVAGAAPVRLTAPIDVNTKSAFPAHLLPNMVPGTSLPPPWRTRLVIDTSDWNPSEEKTLTFGFSVEGYGLVEVEHTFHYEPGPHLEYSMPDGIELQELHYGDVVHSGTALLDELYVTNAGRAPTKLGPPQLLSDGDMPGEIRAEVAWRDASCAPERALHSKESLHLDLTIDLSSVPVGGLVGRELRWSLVLSDDEQEWTMPVIIRKVVEPPPCTRRLAIDFGSTNTYAAVWNDDIRARSSELVIPVLQKLGYDPERFPTVMYFRSLQDPRRPDYLIGQDARDLGAEHPRAMVKGLKQLIGRRNKDGSFPTIWVRDGNNLEVPYEAPELVKLFLRGLIERCEAGLRQRIEKIGISFPTDFSPARIRGYQHILDDLARDLAQETPPRQLDYLPPDLDEAGAVALDYVLNPDMLQGEITKILNDKRQAHVSRPQDAPLGSSNLVIASLDVGGGTVDIALLQVFFEEDEQPENAELRSEYLGFGGDRNFGGETVTEVVFDLVVQQLKAALKAAGDETSSPPLELPLAAPGQQATSMARQNYDSLWEAAEQLKLHLCGNATAWGPSWGANFKSMILPKLRGKGAGASELNLSQDPLLEKHLDSALGTENFGIDLPLVYQHPLQKNGVEYRVQDRLEACIDRLEQFARHRGVQIDVVVLAGAGARLPLVEQLLRDKGAISRAGASSAVVPSPAGNGTTGEPLAADVETALSGTLSEAPAAEAADADSASTREPFRGAVIYHEVDRPKSMVAFGLVRYHEMKEDHEDMVRGLRCSVEYTQKPIGCVKYHQLKEVVPPCSPIFDDAKWYYFQDPLHGVWRSNQNRIVSLFEEVHGQRSPFGFFDLNQPATPPEPADASETGAGRCRLALPDRVPRKNRMAVRFRGSLDRMELKVEIQGNPDSSEDTWECYGYWPLRRELEESCDDI